MKVTVYLFGKPQSSFDVKDTKASPTDKAVHDLVAKGDLTDKTPPAPKAPAGDVKPGLKEIDVGE